MYKFSDKKNREDVISLRWPKACLSCGTDMPDNAFPRHAIVGTFYVDKKTDHEDRRHTQVLVKLPGFFYMCENCTKIIKSAVEDPPRKLEKLVETLQESPWMEFIEVEKSGHVILPDGLFKDKLQKANPEARFKSKASPMNEFKDNLAVE